MAGNMPKEEAMRNYIEELQKVRYFCVQCIFYCFSSDCRDNATV